MNGDVVTYVVTRNVQYTNVCYFRCGFCAFSKGKLAANLRGEPYLVPHDEIVRRAVEAWDRGATEICLQGGIHPAFDGDYYASVVRAIKDAVPDLHVHAFSALEVWQGAATLGVPLRDVPRAAPRRGARLAAGHGGRGARRRGARGHLPRQDHDRAVARGARDRARAGLRSNNTIMFGHVDGPRNWARHLLAVRELQRETGGFTEFVPLPFVHMEAPIYLKGGARRGPTFGEVLLMHAVGRLALHPWIENVQVSWVKAGPRGVVEALHAGVNDLGGTLMNESISRAAGAEWGQELPPEQMEALIRSAGRDPAPAHDALRRAPAEQVARVLRRRAARRAAEPARQRGAAAAPAAPASGAGGGPLAGLHPLVVVRCPGAGLDDADDRARARMARIRRVAGIGLDDHHPAERPADRRVRTSSIELGDEDEHVAWRQARPARRRCCPGPSRTGSS